MTVAKCPLVRPATEGWKLKGLSTAEHVLSIYRQDQHYTHEEAKLLDLCMVVHADHGGGNCSTFADRVLSSAGTDTYSAIAAAIGCLKGPKHGGANLKVMIFNCGLRQLDGGGFEPPKQNAADLQSVPFGHSGIHPYLKKPMIGLEPITC